MVTPPFRRQERHAMSHAPLAGHRYTVAAITCLRHATPPLILRRFAFSPLRLLILTAMAAALRPMLTRCRHAMLISLPPRHAIYAWRLLMLLLCYSRRAAPWRMRARWRAHGAPLCDAGADASRYAADDYLCIYADMFSCHLHTMLMRERRA